MSGFYGRAHLVIVPLTLYNESRQLSNETSMFNCEAAMKKNWKIGWFALILVLLVQLACRVVKYSPETLCKMKGGIWHEEVPKDNSWCEMPKKPASPPTQPEVELYPSATEPARFHPCHSHRGISHADCRLRAGM